MCIIKYETQFPFDKKYRCSGDPYFLSTRKNGDSLLGTE